MTLSLTNDASAGDNSGTSALALTIPSTTAGRGLTLVVACKDAADVVSSISGEGTWAKALDTTDETEGSSQHTEIWWIGAADGGVTSLTVNLAGNTRVCAWFGEWSGEIDHDTASGASATAVGSSDTPASGSFTPTTGGDGVALVAAQHQSTSFSINAYPSGFTQPPAGDVDSGASSGSGIRLSPLYKIEPSGAQTPSWTLSGSRAWGALGTVFTEVGGGATVTVGVLSAATVPSPAVSTVGTVDAQLLSAASVPSPAVSAAAPAGGGMIGALMGAMT